jgi:NAD(P)-dependent dehydrogenase (short-subunit alcohol dehydrogenase family)
MYQAFDLHGKTAIVTGGNSGIGLGMAEALAQAGAAVCIWGTNEEKNHTAVARLHAIGGKAMALRCDVSDEAAVDRGFAETARPGRRDACRQRGRPGRGARPLPR